MEAARVLALLGALFLSAGLALVESDRAACAAEEHYSAHGVVKSFGPKRASLMIAHDRIPGYMEAMTMSFEPRTPDQLAGIDVGARVSFAFTATDDGRRLIDRIAKE
jgi:Cu/Ag efflux protein CusF